MKDWIVNEWKFLTTIGAVVCLIWMALNVRSMASDALQKSDNNAAAIAQVAMLAREVNSQLDLLVKMGAISKQTWEDLRMVPTKPYDSAGQPVPEWYLVGDGAIYLVKAKPDCLPTIVQIPYGEQGK
jgi:hypothetical protein